MDVGSPTTSTSGISLDKPPEQPPASSKGSFMSPPKPAGGIGDLANSPQLMSMQGLAMAKDGLQLIANGLPALSQLLSNTINDLEQLVAQASADAMAGTGPQITAPPGIAPMMTPPPGAAPPSPATPSGMGGGSPSRPFGAA